MTEEEVAHTAALYAGEVTFVDRWLGILLDRIREAGLYDNSLIMFTSDHGEPFGEHGIIRKAQPWNYEELAHIPWLIRHPQGLGGGKRFLGFVQPPDLMPTVLEALGISTKLELHYTGPVKHTFPQDIVKSKAEIVLTGRSLLPLLAGETESIRNFAITAHYGAQWSIRTQEWSYLLNIGDERWPELYNRKTDLKEQNNLWGSNKKVGDNLELCLRRLADEVS